MGRSKMNSAKIEKSSGRADRRQNAKNLASKQVASVLEEELEDDPYGPYGILNYVYDEDESLEEQVAQLKSRVRDLEIFVRNTMRTSEYLKGDFFEWDIVLPSRFPREMKYIFSSALRWANGWAGTDTTSLTKHQKQLVIASLKGYIVQEDFDSIHARLHPEFQKRFVPSLVEIFLNKTIIDTFFRHPFWYVQEDISVAPGDEDNNEFTWDGVSPFGEKLEMLHSNFEKVESEYSQVWRSVTTRLCNSTRFRQAKDLTFGKATQAHREAKCTALARDLLNNEAFLSLLKPTDQTDSRAESLALRLQQISQCAVDMQAQIPTLGFHTLGDLSDRFSPSSDIIESSPFCFEYDDDGNSRLEGHRVLAISWPYVFRTVNDPELEKEIELVAKASAIIEEEDEKKEEEKSGTARRSKKLKA